MAVQVVVPAMGLGARPGSIAEWYAPDGATVHKGECLYRFESEFVAIDVEAESGGVLRHRLEAGPAPAAGSAVAFILAPGERMPEDEDAPYASAPAQNEFFAPTEPAGEAEPVSDGLAYNWPEPATAEEPEYVPPTPFDPTVAIQPPVEDEFDWAAALPSSMDAADEPEDDPHQPVEPLKFRLLSEREPQGSAGWGELGDVPGDDVHFEGPWPARADEAEMPAVEVEEEDTEDWAPPTAAFEEPAAEPAFAAVPQVEPPAFASSDGDSPWDSGDSRPWDLANAPVKDPGEDLHEFLERHDAHSEFESRGDVVEPWDADMAVAAPEVAQAPEPAGLPAVVLTFSATVRMDEARKMREQLTREWRAHGVIPLDEDVVIRAVARAVREHDVLAGQPVDVGLVLTEREGERVAVVRGADGGAFRDAVAALAAESDSGSNETGCSFTVTSFARCGLDEGTPPLPTGHAFAVAMGAVRDVPAFEGDRVVRAPQMTLAMAYAPELITVGEAAALLARIRELVEAPYALLAA